MNITEQTIQYLANLARLELTAQERASFTAELTRVLEYMAKLDALDVSGVEGTSYAVPLTCRERDDRTEPSTLHDDILAAAPQVAEQHFVVPKVVE